jgi:hypothetical protein
LGKLEGRTKVFTLAEVSKLGRRKNGVKPTQRQKKPRPQRESPEMRLRKAVPRKSAKKPGKVERKPLMKERRSFWAFLGIGRGQKTKVSLMHATVKK